MSRLATIAALSSLLTIATGAGAGAQPAPPDASARDWSPLSAGTLSSWLPSGRWNVVVVSAGAAQPDALELRTRVGAALRASGRAALVIDDDTLGDLSPLDDRGVLARARALPVHLVAVLRLVTGAYGVELGGALYDAATATLLGRLVARPGQLPSILPASATRAAGPNAATDPAATPGSDEDAPSKPELAAPPPPPLSMAPAPGPRGLPAQLVSQLIVFGRSRPGGSLEEQEPILGLVQGRRLRGAEFYEAVGRPDLAAEFYRRRRLQLSIMVPGLCAVGVGFMGTYAGASLQSNAMMIGMGALMLAGGAVALGSIAVRRAPVSVDEAQRLARRHNRELKRRFGLPPDSTRGGDDEDDDDGGDARAPLPAAQPVVRVALAPQLHPQGGGLALVGSF